MNIALILDDCLARLARGEAVADCLTRYPGQAAELAPMLVAAIQLRDLSAYQLSGAQRLRGKMALRRALAAQAQPRPWLAWLGRLEWKLKSPAMAAAAALLLFVSLSVGAVAASQPGDLAYGARVVMERVPALVLFDAGDRATAELNTADRRLADLQNTLQRSTQPNPTALQALVRGDEAAAAAADNLPEDQRSLLAERVETHAAALSRLAAAAQEAAAAQSLALAAARASEIAERLRTPPLPGNRPERGTPPEGAPVLRTPPLDPTSAPTVTPAATATVEATAATPTATLDAERATPSPMGAPSRRPTEDTTPRLPTPAETRSERATVMAATVTARPTHTPPPATRRAEQTPAPPRPPTAGPRQTPAPPPIVETRRAATAEPQPTAPPGPPAQPGPTDNPGGPPATSGPPVPRPTRGSRP